MNPESSLYTSVPEQAQVPLFIENIPKHAADLSSKNIEDIDALLSNRLAMVKNSPDSLSGKDFFGISRFASQHGISDEVLKTYLEIKGIREFTSNQHQEEDPGTIRLF